MAYTKRFITGRKCSKVITLLVIVFGIALVIHSIAHVAKPIHPGLNRSLNAGYYLGNNNDTPAMKNAIKVFNSIEERNAIKQTVNMERCVRFFSKRKDSVICVYRPQEDVWISREIVETGAWELDLLNMTRDFYLAEPNMQLLDLGCNVGVFTLTAAILGHNVVAVDANKFNLRMLSMSLTLNDLHDKVTLVWNAVSDVYEEVELGFKTNHVAGTFVRNIIDRARTPTVTTIKIDDLLPAFTGRPALIKIDIEGSEWKALNGAWRFFNEVDVRYVVFEYEKHKGKESGKQIQKFFMNFGFLPYSAPKYWEALDLHNDLNWKDTMLWIKQNKGR